MCYVFRPALKPFAGMPIHKPYKQIYNKSPVILMQTLVAIHEGLNLIKSFIYFQNYLGLMFLYILYFNVIKNSDCKQRAL